MTEEKKDISWVTRVAEKHMNELDEVKDVRKDLILHPGHIYWMINALKEIAEKINEMESKE